VGCSVFSTELKVRASTAAALLNKKPAEIALSKNYANALMS